MESLIRNRIFMEHKSLIDGIFRQNRAIVRRTRMEPEDIYQELAIAALKAIDDYDPQGLNSMETHIWLALQCALLALQRQHAPRRVVRVVTEIRC